MLYSWFSEYIYVKNYTSPNLYWNGDDLKISVQYSLFKKKKYKAENVTFRTKFWLKNLQYEPEK